MPLQKTQNPPAIEADLAGFVLLIFPSQLIEVTKMFQPNRDYNLTPSNIDFYSRLANDGQAYVIARTGGDVGKLTAKVDIRTASGASHPNWRQQEIVLAFADVIDSTINRAAVD